jgi:cytoskeletal protein CcmA (bactofilin family)
MMKKENKIDAVSTFLGHDAGVEGTIEFKGAIRLDGKVKGKIVSNGGTVIIGEKAVIEAEISVDTVIIKGVVNGSIEAARHMEAYPPARITGDIRAPKITINSGVVFNGSCQMDTLERKKDKTT